MSSDMTSFLSRWSRLKRRVSLERETPPKPTGAPGPSSPPTIPRPPEAGGQSPQTIDATKAPAEAATRNEDPVDLSKLPPIESLGRDSDYSVFMRQGVPEDLRLKALRRMWLTDPTISGPDLLEMNALDYTGLEGPRPLATRAIKAVAAVAKAVKEVAGDRAEKPMGSPEEERSHDGAAQQSPAKDDGPDGSESKSV